MLAKTKRLKLKELYENALEIFDSKDFYTMRRKIPKGKEGSFNEMLRQSINPGIYHQWWHETQEYFDNLGLNYLRFKRKVMSEEPSKEYGISDAGYFVRAIDELEKMISDEQYFESYELSKKKPQDWPIVRYNKGVITQGGKIHNFNKFRNESAIKMLDVLWDKRRIIRPDKLPFQEGKAILWEDLPVKSTESNKSTVTAINKAMRTKGITLRVKHPKMLGGVILVVIQKRAN